jgi:hypothetical protein
MTILYNNDGKDEWVPWKKDTPRSAIAQEVRLLTPTTLRKARSN